jgi:hypothetical protein
MTMFSQIQEHMQVVDLRGNHVGVVDRLEEADEIKLTRDGSPDGIHHYIPLDWVENVDRCVHLKMTSADILRSRH